jgi:hypothetical protein
MKGCGEGGGAGEGGLGAAGGRLICIGAQLMGCAQWAHLGSIDGVPGQSAAPTTANRTPSRQRTRPRLEGCVVWKGRLGVVAHSSPGGTIDIRFMPVAFRHRVNKELLSKMRVSALEGRSVQTNPALPPSGSRPDRDPTRHSIWQVLLLFAALLQGCPSRTPRRLRRDQARRCFHFRPR